LGTRNIHLRFSLRAKHGRGFDWQVRKMAFRIVADHMGALKTATRVLAASAAVLAMKWMAEGAQSVKIEIDGRAYELEAFRRRFMNGAGRNGYRISN
jgi:hypothetical protein